MSFNTPEVCNLASCSISSIIFLDESFTTELVLFVGFWVFVSIEGCIIGSITGSIKLFWVFCIGSCAKLFTGALFEILELLAPETIGRVDTKIVPYWLEKVRESFPPCCWEIPDILLSKVS